MMIRTLRFAALAIAVLVGATLSLPAQVSSKRLVHVTVTDPRGRFVAGLEQEHFEVVENGVRHAVTHFSGIDSPISLAIVDDEPSAAFSALNGPGDELIQTRSLPDALRQLAASKNPRKALVIAVAADTRAIPGGIYAVQTTPADLLKAVVELRNQYQIQFESSAPSAGVEVALKQPRNLPVLRANWK